MKVLPSRASARCDLLKILLVVVGLCCFAAPVAKAERKAQLSRFLWLDESRLPSNPAFPFEIRQYRLKNGFRVYAVPFDSPGVVAFVTVVRTGARDDIEPGCSGFAHFFEHMMFKGTRTFSNAAREHEIMLMGAESNAFTSDDCTVYHLVGSSDALERMMQIESDRFRNLSFSEEDLRTEATVILGEYQKSASNPFTKLEEAMRETAFRQHSYRNTVIGRLEDIRAMPEKLEHSRRFYASGYTPSRCSLILVGDIDFSRLKSMLERFYGDWQNGETKSLQPQVEPPQTEERSAQLVWPHQTLPYLYIGYRVPAFSDRDSDIPALEVLSSLIFSTSSPLYRKLVLERQYVEFISGSYDRHRDPYLFTIILRLKKSSDLEVVKREIDLALKEAARHPPAAERLEAVKSNLRYGLAQQLNTPLGTAFTLGEFLWLTGDARSLSRHVSGLSRVEAKDVMRVADRYFQPSGRTIVTLTMEEKP